MGDDELKQMIREFRASVSERFDQVDRRFDGLEGRMDGLEGRMDGLEGRMDRLEGRLDSVEGRMSELELTMVAQGAELRDRLRTVELGLTNSINEWGHNLDARLRLLEKRDDSD